MTEEPYLIIKDVPKRAKYIASFLSEVIAEIKNLVSLTAPQENRLRFAIIELCTNRIKHSKESNTVFEFQIEKNRIQIIKKVDDQLFKSNLLSKLSDLRINEIVDIYFSESNNHFIEILSECKFRFLDPIKMGFKTENLKDHFGLHIITLCADEFIYTFDDETKSERFCVSMGI